ncbi:MAG TPA: hypothetical protein VJM80_12605 [bacterium]|nr:hypothetical protein [bacterium]
MSLKDGIERLRTFFLKKREIVGESVAALAQERRRQFRRQEDLILKGVEEDTVEALVDMSIRLLEERRKGEEAYPQARRSQHRRRQDQVIHLLMQELKDPAFLSMIEELIRLQSSGNREAMEEIQKMLQPPRVEN